MSTYTIFILNSEKVLYTNIDQTLAIHYTDWWNREIGGLECRAITTEYRTCVHCIHM